jgi:hypothetical protein
VHGYYTVYSLCLTSELYTRLLLCAVRALASFPFFSSGEVVRICSYSLVPGRTWERPMDGLGTRLKGSSVAGSPHSC